MSFAELKYKLPSTVLKANEENSIGKSWNVWSKQLEDIDSAVTDLTYMFDIDVQSGVILDLIGKILREGRGDRVDSEYKIFLFIAIKKIISGGSVPDLNDVLRSLLGDYFILIRNLYPENSGTSWGSDSQYKFWLDGTRYLDGSFFLSSNIFSSAFFEIQVMETTPLSLQDSLAKIVDAVKPAGVNFRIAKVGE